MSGQTPRPVKRDNIAVRRKGMLTKRGMRDKYDQLLITIGGKFADLEFLAFSHFIINVHFAHSR